MEKRVVVHDNLLTIPADAGRAIVESGCLIACPLLGMNKFVKFCQDRGLSINKDRLLRLERLGLFSPIFRVRTPDEDVPAFYIPVKNSNNWFDKGWAFDTTAIGNNCLIPELGEREQEAYYSIFQIDYLYLIISEFNLNVQLDSYLDREDKHNIDWKKNGESWMQFAESRLNSLRTHEYRRSVALLCQYISNRYYPQTQSNQRTIRVGGTYSSDKWISVNGFDWDWLEEAKNWNPRRAEKLFDLTPEKLRHAYNGISVSQESCDPLERWYQLTQFVNVDQRNKLKGDALRAETLRAGAHMLRLLYEELYGEELPHPNEVTGTIMTHVPELSVRGDPRRYLEFVVNRYGLNPQPKLSLIVEGKTEEIAVTKIFEEYFGVNPGKYGIEIIVLGSVDVATGSKKEDRFRAILRLVDYLHHHQTITFLILDNENYAEKLKREAKKSKSIHSDKRYVTRPEYIRIWKDAFEFDNFSCTEIAHVMTILAQGKAQFTSADVNLCKKGKNPGASLQRLYKDKADYGLPKLKLNEILVDDMMSPNSRRKIENRPIIKVLVKVAELASKNPFPTMHEIWEKNQESTYLGKKIRPVKK
jgi:hypothetical protein